MRRSMLLAMLAICAIHSGGCSVFISAAGRKGTDTSFLLPGVERTTVIAKLGPPLSSTRSEQGLTVDSWVINTGVKPNGLWAVTHATLDVLTIGLWEIVGTPASMVGHELEDKKQDLTVTYDQQLRIRDVNLAMVDKKPLKPKPL